ncbi:hypothetical protein [Flavilitoribacter nigricans]|uniref:Uncharacterized protein n=1 Tax=Flavilitoribacter nigricans (strain ATCC 23147 / DSM 23189 / NBRC 102662 / NCIMB 1420 / SS-2) TaxID=1122177 RepID=A0A2D0N1Q9_FLAN2|nr:hypothetical protein [Flavilitoribacter nigricans]PHN02318.1 hypothetical protein CRP01_33010 [Flavilitoribacter nigricans DSM 23189 = NBRC 102662]
MRFRYLNEFIFEIHFFFENIRGNEPYSSTLFFTSYLFFDLIASVLLILKPAIFSTLTGCFSVLIAALILARIVLNGKLDSEDYLHWQETGQASRSRLILIWAISLVAMAIFILTVISKQELLMEMHE